jgi:hypothetical protein
MTDEGMHGGRTYACPLLFSGKRKYSYFVFGELIFYYGEIRFLSVLEKKNRVFF